MGWTVKALALLRLVERRFLAICMIVMAIAYFVNVAVRTVYPAVAVWFVWIEEATLYIFAWVVFVGLGLVLERCRHISMTAVVERLSDSQQFYIQKLVNLVGLIFSIYVCYLGYRLTLFILASGQVSPTLNVSVAVLYASLPVGFALLSLRYLLELLGFTNRFRAGRGAPLQ
jgi:C4-dicarboxylate transporter, DctQ subunit